MTDAKLWLAEAARFLGSIGAIAAFIWFIGEPHAASLITDTVKQQGYASQQSVENLNTKVFEQNKVLKETNERGIRVEERQKSTLEEIKDIKRLLLQRRN